MIESWMMTCRHGALACFLAALSIATLSAAEPDNTPKSIVGYLPDYRIAEYDLTAARGLTDLVIFSAEPTATGELDLNRLTSVSWKELRAFQAKENVRLILGLGGWGRSNHFPAVVESAQYRQRFVEAIVRFCQDKGLQGVDLDWEHPQNDQEQEGYAILLSELKETGKSNGLKVSLTVAAWQSLPAKAIDAVDTIHLMSYDHPGRHSTFESAEAEVRQMIDRGIPKHKIILGLPFYGRHTSKPELTKTYREIAVDPTLKPTADEVDNFYFNGPTTIARKTQYAMEHGLAGVMVWELAQDAPGDKALLKVVCETVRQGAPGLPSSAKHAVTTQDPKK